MIVGPIDTGQSNPTGVNTNVVTLKEVEDAAPHAFSIYHKFIEAGGHFAGVPESSPALALHLMHILARR